MDSTEAPPGGETLSELRSLLIAEREALKAFDTRMVAVISSKLVGLEETLRETYASGRPIAPDERKVLVEIRELALRNQVLLVHAKASVQGIVASLMQRPVAPSNRNGLPALDGNRLNVQG